MSRFLHRCFSAMRLSGTLLVFALRVGIAQGVPGGNPATTPVPRAEAWWAARHREKMFEAQRGGVDLLFVGDSITENYEKAGPAPDQVFAPIWAELFSAHRAMNLGFSGDDTEHVLWRLQHGEVDGLRPRNVVLLIGTNNTARGQRPEQVAAGVIAVVQEMQRLMPGARVLVLGILPSGISAEKSEADARVNAMARERFAHSADVRTLDLGGLFLRDGLLDAGLFYDPGLGKSPLHPNAVGQRRMAEAVAAALYGNGGKAG